MQIVDEIDREKEEELRAELVSEERCSCST
jgi:hypothetical protein